MKKFTQIKVEDARLIEFLFFADLESELHPNEDPKLGVHAGEVLKEMLKEVRCEGPYSHLNPPHFILSNGDEDSRFDKEYEYMWRELEDLSCPCYYVLGNHGMGCRPGTGGEDWRNYFGYEDTYYAWEYSLSKTTITFIVLDTWCIRERDGRLSKIKCGTGCQVLREEEKEWLKKMLDRAPGLVVVFAHAHIWLPNSRTQDNEAMEELIDILKGTYEEGIIHNQTNVFFNGGHHGSPDCDRVDGVYFLDPIGAIHGGYARVIIDPVYKKMDYMGRLNEKSYLGLDLSVYPQIQKPIP